MNLHRNVGAHIVVLCAVSMLVGTTQADAASSRHAAHLDAIHDRIEERMTEHRARLEEHVGRLHERVCEHLSRIEEHWGVTVHMPWYCTSGTVLPTVTLHAADTNMTQGASTTLSWTSVNAATCTASGGWSGSRALSGSEVVSPTATTTYTLSCTNSAGSDSNSVTVSVHASGTPVPTQTPNISFDASSHAVNTGGTSTLSWSAQYADTCTASGASDWSGTHATSGSTIVTVSATTTYVLFCSNSAGTSTASTTVAAQTPYSEPLPSVDLSATPSVVTEGGTSTLNWMSTDADMCVASGGWSGARATSGNEVVSLSATTTYLIACTNTTGTATDSVQVVVDTPTILLGKVVISEVMYDVASTSQGDEGDNEWVELYNGTGDPIDLAGWKLRDNTATDTISTSSVHIVPAGGRVIIVSTSTTAQYWTLDPSALVINLNSANGIGNGLAQSDILRLYDSLDHEQDAISWGGNSAVFESSGLVALDGKSVARIPVTVDTDTKNDWVVLTTPTPGS